MRPLFWSNWIIVCLLLSSCASGEKQKSGQERGPDGTVAYMIRIDSSLSGANIEADGEYVGKAPMVLRVFGDRDGTFHNFGSPEFVLRATLNGQEEIKSFRTGGFFAPEDRIPSAVYFSFSGRAALAEEARPGIESDGSPNGFLGGGSADTRRNAKIRDVQEAGDTKLMLFAGNNNKVYLGCINCDASEWDSVVSEVGPKGKSSTGRYSEESIWNRFGPFGSRLSNTSPWSTFASDPPIIVDQDGNYYGRFTLNKFHPERTRVASIIALLELMRPDQ
jgi:hypothetical protein